MPDAGGRHRFEDAQRADDVVAVVAERVADRFADVEKCREMDHRPRLVTPQRLAQRRDVRDVAFDEIAVLRRLAMPGGEIVVHDDAIPGPRERLRGVAADVAGAAGDEHRLETTPATDQLKST